jgi:phosphatidylserine/phosphatidylglycerophosphate/cardiolipin synthase-like enzyme
MNRSAVACAIGLCLLLTSDSRAASCTGSASCRVCTNCSRCAHCKGGGSCGVCAGGSRVQPPPAPPRTTTPPPTPKAETEGERRARERAAALQAAREQADRQREASAKAEAAKAEAARKAAATTRPAAKEDGVTIYFSPNGGCTAAIVREIGKAKTSLQVQAYRLTSPPVATAILLAHKRGVKVTILLDQSQQTTKYSDATFYHNLGMLVLIDRGHAIAHNKVMIIDGVTVITGSFNFSQAAESSNAENLLVLEGKPVLAAAYVGNFEAHKKHCEPYRPPTGTAGAPETRPAAVDPAGQQASLGDDVELLRPVR